MSKGHNREFLFNVLDDLRSLPVMVFGGWAEEILGIIPKRFHADVDLMLASDDFAELESLLAGDTRYTDIPQKRFSHKRAYEKDGVRIEIFLIHPHTLQTLFFDRLSFAWPSDTLHQSVQCDQRVVPVASRTALELYRREHSRIMNTGHAEPAH